MNGRHMITVSVIVALTLAATVCASCRNGGGTAASKPAASERGAEGSNGIVRIGPDAQRTIGLQTTTVREGTVAGEITTTAVIKPNDYRLVHVSPRIPGKAISVQAQLGDLVRPGQVLADLDSIELGQRKGDYLRAKADLDVDRRNYERERKLYREQISSEKEFLDAKGAFERSQANYQSARETLKLVGLSDREIVSLTWSPVGGHPLSHFPLTA